jgi:hypothetical protein
MPCGLCGQPDPQVSSVPFGDNWSWDGSTRTQIATFGANPCFNAAMASSDVQIAMFGGIDSSNAILRETWIFDGRHWTHRQDIGPLPRTTRRAVPLSSSVGPIVRKIPWGTHGSTSRRIHRPSGGGSRKSMRYQHPYGSPDERQARLMACRESYAGTSDAV